MSIRVLDLYFDEPMAADVHADIVRYIQFSRPVPGIRSAPTWTMLLDITQEPSQMLAKMKDHTRYKLRRAERDNLTYEHSDGRDGRSIKRFADHHDQYASMKGLPKVSRKRYEILAAQDALDLSFMSDSSGELLVASSCVVTPSRVRGLHLAAAFRGTSDGSRRSLIGRANRYLRWRDILRFREMRIKTFDFGGWYRGEGDAVRTNEFKAEFCGEVVKEFLSIRSLTLEGRIASALLNGYARIATTRAAANASMREETREGSIPA